MKVYFKNFLKLIFFNFVRSLLCIQAAMMTNLAEKIPAKMEAKGLKVDCSAQETATEADWFFDFLEAVKTA